MTFLWRVVFQNGRDRMSLDYVELGDALNALNRGIDENREWHPLWLSAARVGRFFKVDPVGARALSEPTEAA
jgi:hypothetical protein